MVEHRPGLNFFCHAVLITALVVIMFPVWFTFVASTQTADRMRDVPLPLWPGGELWQNVVTVLKHGVAGASTAPVGRMMVNSLIMALSIAIGKIVISIISAYAIVYFKFRLRSARRPHWRNVFAYPNRKKNSCLR